MTSRCAIACLVLFLAPAMALADLLPKTVPAAACLTPPTIDGTIGVDEWRDAKAIDFDLEMVRVNPPGKATRACSLRVMNSANALYIALRVPDSMVNATINPLDYDLAILAFCRGKDLQAGDDRKVVAPGLYADKHIVSPGKDADDKQKDGLGVVGHEAGVYTFEWAIPLDSGDAEDLKAKPGDKVKFNLAFFDRFQADLKETQAGGLFGPDMDNAENWGTLELADNVKDDGGAAFKGPAWAASALKSAGRLKVAESTWVPGIPRPIARVRVSFPFRDPKGAEKVGQATVYLPAAVGDNLKTKFPLFFAAGYEIDDATAAAHVRRGFAVVSPRALETNPLIRTTNPDTALLHSIRSLPFVDDAHVVIGGGSAGGYMTLMLAAETFPLAAAAPDVPPVNWGYNAAYFFKQKDLLAPPKAEAASPVPVLNAVGGMLAPATTLYGAEYGDATWFAHSPVAHVPTITCPVSAYWTTADVLVPMDQVGSKWVKPFDAKTFPVGFTMDPTKFADSKEGRTRLLDVLKDGDYEVFEVMVKKGEPKAIELPLSKKQWAITILDEGVPEPTVGHLKYPGAWTREKFLEQAKSSKTLADQLTATKLERLMDRYAGKEWLPSPLTHLDEPASEKADVLRGLRTYTTADPENAKRFADLYGKLPAVRRVLADGVVKELAGGK